MPKIQRGLEGEPASRSAFEGGADSKLNFSRPWHLCRPQQLHLSSELVLCSSGLSQAWSITHIDGLQLLLIAYKQQNGPVFLVALDGTCLKHKGCIHTGRPCLLPGSMQHPGSPDTGQSDNLPVFLESDFILEVRGLKNNVIVNLAGFLQQKSQQNLFFVLCCMVCLDTCLHIVAALLFALYCVTSISQFTKRTKSTYGAFQHIHMQSRWFRKQICGVDGYGPVKNVHQKIVENRRGTLQGTNIFPENKKSNLQKVPLKGDYVSFREGMFLEMML